MRLQRGGHRLGRDSRDAEAFLAAAGPDDNLDARPRNTEHPGHELPQRIVRPPVDGRGSHFDLQSAAVHAGDGSSSRPRLYENLDDGPLLDTR